MVKDEFSYEHKYVAGECKMYSILIYYLLMYLPFILLEIY